MSPMLPLLLLLRMQVSFSPPSFTCARFMVKPRGRTGSNPTAGLAKHRHQRLACHCGIYILIFFHFNRPMPVACKSSRVHWRKKAPSSSFSRMISFKWPRAMTSKNFHMSSTLHLATGPAGMPEWTDTSAAPPPAGAAVASAGAVPPPADGHLHLREPLLKLPWRGSHSACKPGDDTFWSSC